MKKNQKSSVSLTIGVNSSTCEYKEEVVVVVKVKSVKCVMMSVQR